MPNKFNELLLKPDIIELYNEGITPNYGYLLNGRFEKDMVRTLYPLPTLNGNPITWEASGKEYLFPSVSLQPKQAGTGDPSPENVRPISGWDEVTVNVGGKNLISDETFQSSEKNGITFTKKGNGVVHIEGTSTALADSVGITDMTQLPPGKYFGIDTLYFTVAVKKANTGQNKYYTASKGVTIEPGDVIQYCYFSIASGSTVNEDVYIFLAAGDSAFSVSDFEPYQPGTTATLTLPETIYGGTVDAVTGEGSAEYIFKELAIADMNNSEDFPGWQYQDWINECINNPQQDGSFLALGIYGTTSIADISKGQFWRINSFNTQIYSTPDQWGGKTQSQIKETYPDLVVQFCLKLVTPKSFQATGNQQLTSLLGYNTIYTDGDSIALSRKARRLEV